MTIAIDLPSLSISQFLNAVTDELIVLKKEKLHYFNGNLAEYERQIKKKMKYARRLQEGLDKKKEAIEKSIIEGKKQAKKSGDENRQRMIKNREKKLQDRWGLETNAAGHRFKVSQRRGEVKKFSALINPLSPSPAQSRLWWLSSHQQRRSGDGGGGQEHPVSFS